MPISPKCDYDRTGYSRQDLDAVAREIATEFSKLYGPKNVHDFSELAAQNAVAKACGLRWESWTNRVEQGLDAKVSAPVFKCMSGAVVSSRFVLEVYSLVKRIYVNNFWDADAKTAPAQLAAAMKKQANVACPSYGYSPLPNPVGTGTAVPVVINDGRRVVIPDRDKILSAPDRQGCRDRHSRCSGGSFYGPGAFY